MSLLNLLFLAAGLIIFLLFLFMVIVSSYENETKAGLKAFILMLLLPSPFILAGLTVIPLPQTIKIIFLSMFAFTIIAFFLPINLRSQKAGITPVKRIDERNIMFSRRLYKMGTERYEQYYKKNPGKKELDDIFRQKPGLLEKGSVFYNDLTFNAAQSTFSTVEKFKDKVDGVLSVNKVEHSPEEFTKFIEGWILKLGAVSVGITELKDYHLYSVVGRGKDFGKTVTKEHRFAIAFTVEMDKQMMDNAPYGATVMESAQQYLSAGTIAIQAAEFIRNLGYAARAHIDGNYRVVCPLVARDAGLGEIGRMGLLMTPELGPRVRLAVVTTDLLLILDEAKYESSVIDFCTSCKKCAEVCPSKAISFEDRKLIDGIERWQVNQEACFTYWCSAGTDCGRCVSVCPYSHPNNLLHNFVRYGIKTSTVFRRAALTLDNFFYGRKPLPKKPPNWI